jgi:hypothetical protein
VFILGARARDEELYSILDFEHGMEEGEVRDLLVQLLKKGLIHWLKSGFTRISI